MTSAAVLGTFFGAVAMTAPAMAGTHPAATNAPAATGTDISYEFDGGSGCVNHSPLWKYCLYYQQNLGGAYWGSSQQTFRTIIATYPDDGLAGQGKPVRNDAASMVDNTPNCHVTTWVNPGYSGDFNWLLPTYWGNLTPPLHNNEAAISYNTCY